MTTLNIVRLIIGMEIALASASVILVGIKLFASKKVQGVVSHKIQFIFHRRAH